MNALDNQYVRTYYDSYLENLSGEYEYERWHKTPQREFEYQQMAHSLERALGGQYGEALEIGPGDAVWTKYILAHAARIHLVEQSREMIARAKSKLGDDPRVTYEENDLMRAKDGQFDLVIAIRCFEYFDDKKAALAKMRSLLKKGGRLIVITKNPNLVGSKGIQQKTLHTRQIARQEMIALLAECGFTAVQAYPAVFRLKSDYRLSRFIFGALHRLIVRAESTWFLPWISKYAAESYVYRATL